MNAHELPHDVESFVRHLGVELDRLPELPRLPPAVALVVPAPPSVEPMRLEITFGGSNPFVVKRANDT